MTINAVAANEIVRRHTHALKAWARFRDNPETAELAYTRLGEVSAYETALELLGIKYRKWNNGTITIDEACIA